MGEEGWNEKKNIPSTLVGFMNTMHLPYSTFVLNFSTNLNSVNNFEVPGGSPEYFIIRDQSCVGECLDGLYDCI